MTPKMKKTEKTKILLIEKSEELAKQTLEHLSKSCYELDILLTCDSEFSTKKLLEQNPDIIICNYGLEQTRSQILLVLKEYNLEIPVIFISDLKGEETAVQAMLEGASNYLLRENLNRLPEAIEKEILKSKSREEQKEIESAIEKYQKLLKLALSAAQIGIWEWNFSTNEIYLSPEALEIMGLEKQAGTVKEYLKLVFPEDREKSYKQALEFIETQKLFHVEFRFLSPKKGLIWLASSGKTDYDEEGRPQKAIGVVQNITLRKESEERLKQTQNLIRLVADVVPAMIAYIDRELICRFANKTFLKSCGLPIEKVLNKHLAEIVGEKLFKKMMPCIKEILMGGKAFSRQEKSEKNGRTKYYLINYIPNTDESGAVRGCFLFILDTTETQTVLEFLRESENRFASLVKSTSQIVWVGSIRNEKPKITVLFDLNNPKLEPEERFHPEDYEKALEELKEAAKEKKAYEAEYRVFNSEKRSYHKYLLKGFPVLDREENVQEFIGTMTDITEKEIAEREIRFQANLLNMVNQAIITTDLKGRITYWNKFAESLFGWKFDEVRRKQALKLIIPNDVLSFAKEVTAEVAKGSEWSGEILMKRRDGSKFIASCNLSLALDERGELAVIGLIQDITDKKEAERNLQESLEQLRQAQKLESIGRLASGIAHDFNNMLTAIRGYSDLALRQLKDDNIALRRSIEEIKKAAERSAELTQRLLAFSRRQVMQMQVLDINQVIKDTIFLLQHLISESISIVTFLRSKLRFVEADPSQLSQILINLATNSRDAMPNGGTITIETEDVFLDEKFVAKQIEAKVGRYVKILFKDTGHGMDAETLKHIFEPFFTTKPIGVGTGLGLSTVYGIVKQLNGFITCESKIGEGTVFEIFLPLSEKALNTTDIVSEQEKPETVIAKGTILLVEDEKIVRDSTRQILESYGHKVLEACDAKEAFSLWERERANINLIISDIVMPKISGYDFVRKIRQECTKVPILLMSGFVDRLEELKFTQDKNLFFIQKPFSYDSLTQKIEEILENKRASSN
jgi:PAS domain S-box-containing protein